MGLLNIDFGASVIVLTTVVEGVVPLTTTTGNMSVSQSKEAVSTGILPDVVVLALLTCWAAMLGDVCAVFGVPLTLVLVCVCEGEVDEGDVVPEDGLVEAEVDVEVDPDVVEVDVEVGVEVDVDESFGGPAGPASSFLEGAVEKADVLIENIVELVGDVLEGVQIRLYITFDIKINSR